MKRVLVALVGLVACASTAPPPTHAVRIQHRESGGRAQHVELPFGQGQNGSLVLLALLERAEAAGAAYVTDLALHLVFKRMGVPVECTQRVLLGGELQPPAVSDFDAQTVTFTANERELSCKTVRRAVDAKKKQHLDRFDVDVGEPIDRVPEDRVVEFESRDECTLVPVTRSVTRYDYQQRLGFVPPQWPYFASRYADTPLRASPPVCKTIDPGAEPKHRLTATVVFNR
jgi:hypothetical protein